MSKLLILRPEPGASATAARAAAIGLDPVAAPLFGIVPLAFDPPPRAGIDALFLTSANAARHGGLEGFADLPCYAVGEASARTAGAAGCADIRIGPGDGAALLEMMANDGIGRAYHPCGRDHVGLDHPAIMLERRLVYASEPLPSLPEAAAAAIAEGALVLLHSPRAAACFASLLAGARGTVSILAISKAAAIAAGPGWRDVAVAPAPRDEAMLELAAMLCQTAPGGAEILGE